MYSIEDKQKALDKVYIALCDLKTLQPNLDEQPEEIKRYIDEFIFVLDNLILMLNKVQDPVVFAFLLHVVFIILKGPDTVFNMITFISEYNRIQEIMEGLIEEALFNNITVRQ